MRVCPCSAIVVAFLFFAPVVREPLNAQAAVPRDTGGQVPSAPRTYADSLRLCNGTNGEMIVCNTARLDHAEAELRAVSRQLLQELRATGREESGVSESLAVGAFLQAQNRWRTRCDSECQWRYGWRVGSMYLPVVVACEDRLTPARGGELQSYRRELRQESR